jgi:lipocalin-like protein
MGGVDNYQRILTIKSGKTAVYSVLLVAVLLAGCSRHGRPGPSGLRARDPRLAGAWQIVTVVPDGIPVSTPSLAERGDPSEWITKSLMEFRSNGTYRQFLEIGRSGGDSRESQHREGIWSVSGTRVSITLYHLTDVFDPKRDVARRVARTRTYDYTLEPGTVLSLPGYEQATVLQLRGKYQGKMATLRLIRR